MISEKPRLFFRTALRLCQAAGKREKFPVAVPRPQAKRASRLLRAVRASGTAPASIDGAAPAHRVAPQGRAHQGPKTRKAVFPLGRAGQEAEQHINQQGPPDCQRTRWRLARSRLTAGLFDLLEEHLDLPPAAIEISDGLRAPVLLLVRKSSPPHHPVHQGTTRRRTSGTGLWISRREHDQIVAQDMAIVAPLPTFDHPTLRCLWRASPRDPRRSKSNKCEKSRKPYRTRRFTAPQSGTDFPGTLVVVVFGGVDDRKGGQKLCRSRRR